MLTENPTADRNFWVICGVIVCTVIAVTVWAVVLTAVRRHRLVKRQDGMDNRVGL